eukprot:1170361-Rhodomonas_salina.1
MADFTCLSSLRSASGSAEDTWQWKFQSELQTPRKTVAEMLPPASRSPLPLGSDTLALPRTAPVPSWPKISAGNKR